MSAIIENNLHVSLSECLPTCEIKSGNVFAPIKSKIRIWVARSRQRKQLARLDDHLLSDIGYTREQVQVEISKPFWR